jgi:hypothetical protein
MIEKLKKQLAHTGSQQKAEIDVITKPSTRGRVKEEPSKKRDAFAGLPSFFENDKGKYGLDETYSQDPSVSRFRLCGTLIKARFKRDPFSVM